MKALIIGGAGATGRAIIHGLLQRSFAVTALGRGKHTLEQADRISFMQADPHEKDQMEAALADQQFDLAIVTYGRLRHAAEVLAGKTTRLISVGGAAPIYKGWGEMTSMNPWETTEPTPLFLAEDHPLARAETPDRFAALVRKTEEAMLQMHREGVFNVTHFRYPLVYGPNNICPAEWSLVRRFRDGRRPLILPGGGLTLVSRGYAENVAHGILLAVDKPGASAGQVYNICDNQLLYNHEWVSRVSQILGHSFETVDIPFRWLPSGFRATSTQLLYRHHGVMSIEKIKQQLGYRDLVSAEEAIERTVRWYHDHPLDAGHEAERNLGDPFDYAYEDAVIAAYRKASAGFIAEEKGLERKPVVWKHTYQ